MQLTDDIRYEALLKKDASFEGIFFAGVKTTGIFCISTCTARKPQRENVEFFETSQDAIRNGYRPCKICKPLSNPKETPEYISKIIEDIVKNPYNKIKDCDLRKMGIEPNRIRRWFKNSHGITFQSFQRMMRINSAYKKLTEGDKVTKAAFDSGYESLSGFHDAFKMISGSKPVKSKETNIINITRISTPLGPMFACAVKEGICLLDFTDRRMLENEFKTISRLLNARIIYGENKHFITLNKQLNEYFEGKRKSFDIPLVFPGTDFQIKAWKILIRIPYGKTISYKEEAVKLGSPKAVRAAGRANGMNRISIIIPCHRVIAEDGNLTGYGGGLWRKKWLIDFEKKNNRKI
jgi:AraC family transcriptional regulator, regulatory protein of adaptative response / methylated-DNA-[protein]-cysteine methyltransferase